MNPIIRIFVILSSVLVASVASAADYPTPTEGDAAAFLAIRAQIPVVPLAMIGLRNILRMHTLTFHRGKVTLRIGQPISTDGMTTHDRAKLTAAVRQAIVEMLD